ncbi:MAG: ABC transporter substrate-binding protein [Pseudomonadota bacterium]
MTDKRLIQRMLADRRTSRRDFMVGATALGLSASAASGLWTSALASTPKRGGHAKFGLLGGNTSDSLDGATYLDTVMICVARACRDSLVEVGQDNTAQPGLAESWEASADAKTWRFKLRPGVEFSNGKSLTTEDVINSVNTHRGEDSKSGAKGVFAGIEDLKADGDVIEFTLADGNADFPFLLTDYHMNIIPTVDGKADVLSMHGTGLYQLEEFEPGIRISMKRAPNAWQQDKFGFFDSAEVIVISDGTARQNAIVTQAVDAINRPDLRTMATIKRAPHLAIQDVPSNLMFTMPMRVDVKPFDDNNVRMAIKHGINRQELLDKILFGYGSLGNDNPIGPGFKNHAPDIAQNTYDPDKAKWYLQQSDLTSVDVPLHTADTAFVGANDAAQLVASSLGKIGVNVNVIREPDDGYWSNVWNNKPWCNCYWGSRPVEDMILSIQYLSDAPWNDMVSKDARVDELIIAARAELDEAKRGAQYREVQEIVSSTFGNVVWAFGSDVAVVNKKISYGSIGGGWEMDGGHAIKRWWMV